LQEIADVSAAIPIADNLLRRRDTFRSEIAAFKTANLKQRPWTVPTQPAIGGISRAHNAKPQ
jgi:hypothetical protein